MRSRLRRRLPHQPVPLIDVGTIQGHRIQALAERSSFIVDGDRAILCTPLEYQLAALLLRASPGVPVRDDQLLAHLSTDRRSLRDLITALRPKFRPLGLHIASVPRYGYLLLEQADSGHLPSPHAGPGLAPLSCVPGRVEGEDAPMSNAADHPAEPQRAKETPDVLFISHRVDEERDR